MHIFFNQNKLHVICISSIFSVHSACHRTIFPVESCSTTTCISIAMQPLNVLSTYISSTMCTYLVY